MNFQTLQNALADSAGAQLVHSPPTLTGYDLLPSSSARPCAASSTIAGKLIRYSPDVSGAGAEVFRQACTHPGSEPPLLPKLADSPYVGLRTRNWVKVKCSLRMANGHRRLYRSADTGRTGFGAQPCSGHHDQGELRFSGKVGTGFDDRLLDDLRRKLDKLEAEKAAVRKSPARPCGRKALIGSLENRGKSNRPSGARAANRAIPSFVGLREDKLASDVVRDKNPRQSVTLPFF